MLSLFRRYIPVLTVIQIAMEVALFFATVLFAYYLHTLGHEMVDSQALVLGTVFALVMVLASAAFGLYRTEGRAKVISVIAYTLLAFLLGILIVKFVTIFVPVGRRFLDSFGVTALFALILTLLLRQLFTVREAQGDPAHRILVVGTGEAALAVDNALRSAGSRHAEVIGFIAANEGSDPLVAQDRVVAPGQSIEEVAKRLKASEVVIAVQERRGGVLPLRQLLECRLNGIPVTDLHGFFERMRGEVPVETLRASWLIYGEGFRQNRTRALVKRSFDILSAIALLSLALPVMLFTAIAIVVESGFPIFYRQERVGLNGRIFKVIKFRSMRQDAEKDGQARWAVAGDPRVTRVGRLIRKTRIDELPQLISVLKGDMSMVGPRPERLPFVEQLSERVPFYGVRHSVKPGLTGWAQVRFQYGASFEDAVRKLQFDLYYVKNHSLVLDFLIMLETVRVVLNGEGAH